MERQLFVRLALRGAALILAAALTCVAQAQSGGLGLPGGLGTIPPQLIDQFRNMSPADQRRIARQYGIDLDSLNAIEQLPTGPGVGEPGEPLQSDTPFRYFGEETRRRRADRDAAGRSDERIIRLEPGNRYGIDLFDAEVSSFAPVDNAPVPPDYRLGPGDSLNVMLVGKENRDYELILDRDGSVRFPELGRIAVAGMTIGEATRAVRARVEAQLIGAEPIISAGRLRAINVFLAGEVRVPGSRSMSALSRITHALFASGGLTDIGSLRRITVNRGGEEVARFDAYDLLIRGDASGDVRLQDGDVVFVPPVQDMASIGGEVRRPAVYELRDDTTLGDLVGMAGGLTARALRRRALVERQGDEALPRIETVSLEQESLRSTKIERGDLVRVLSNADRFENRIVLKGAVQRPGVYGYALGMRVSDLITNVESDLTENVDYGYSLIVSQDSETGRISVRPFSVREVLAAPASDRDPLLKPRDQVLLFNNVAAAIGALRARDREADYYGEPGGDSGDDPFGEAGSVQENGDPAAGGAPRQARDDMAMRDQAVGARGFDGDGLQLGADAGRDGTRRRGSAGPDADRQEREAEALEPNRQRLLAPIIARLEAQASPDDPVRIVAVSGAVHAAGNYPLNPGDTVGDLLAAAGGLRDDAFIREVELQRVLTDSTGSAVIDNVRLDLSNADTSGLGATLESRDHLFVRRIPDWRPSDMVVVEGEVRFPGTYLIGPGETLSDLLERVGGLTPQAFAEGVVFTREGLREQEERETRRFISELRTNVAASTLTEEGTQISDLTGLDELAESLMGSEYLGRLIVDVPRVLAGDDSADVVLQAGDAIRIPPRVNTVTVIGEVQRPGSYRFQERYGIDDYVATSAGTTRRADEKRMYVLRATGEIQLVNDTSLFTFNLSDSSVRPGDTIVVPIDTSYRNTLDYWSVIVQIAYQSGIALAAVLAIQ